MGNGRKNKSRNQTTSGPTGEMNAQWFTNNVARQRRKKKAAKIAKKKNR